LRSIDDVFILASDCQDQKGNPLFDDPIKDPFLSSKYSETAVGALMGYGLQVNFVYHIVNLLKLDLESDSSKMRKGNMTEDWHSCLARLLSNHLEKTPTIRSLRILPLRDGTWTSCEEGPVYLPSTGGIQIPATLDLRVLDSAAIQNPDRRSLFKQLGVDEATTAQVRQSINTIFGAGKAIANPIILKFLIYLYLTHQSIVHTREQYRNVWVRTKDNEAYYTHGTIIYLPGTDHPYSPESLLSVPGTAPGFSVPLLNDLFSKGGPAEPRLFHPSWKDWLVSFIGIHERFGLLSPGGDALSEPFLWVFNQHPDKYLGLFEYLWVHDRKKLLESPTVVSKIEDLSAKRLCKVNFSPKLKNTWLPYQHLQDLVQRYMEHPDQFPFLKIERDDTDLGLGMKWNFLVKHFSVGKDDDIEFLLEILTCIERSCPSPSSIRQSQRVFDLYIAIYAKLSVAKDHVATASRIK